MSNQIAPSASDQAPDPAAAPQTAPPAAGSGSEQPAVHPVYERALEHIPEAWRAPIVAEFQNIERETQKAIEKARQEATPAEWKQLIEEAKAAGVDPDTLIHSYNAQDNFQQRLYSDPEAFLGELSTFVEQERAAGRITAKQAAAQQQQIADAAAAAGNGDLFETPEAKEIAEIRKELQTEREQRQQREQEELKRQQEAQQQQAAEAYADEFFNTKEQVFREVGILAADGAAVLPLPQQQQILYTAAEALERDPRLTMEQAVRAATTNYIETLKQFGGTLPTAPAAAQQQSSIPPVLGAGTGNPPAAQAPAPLNSKERSSEAVRVMREMLGNG